MQKVINELINKSIEGIDTYRYKDSTWLIFSDDLKWVVELTDCGTLWFNYRHFKSLLRYVSLDVGEGKEYITAWAESYFFGKKIGWKIFDSTSIHKENMARNIVDGRGIKETRRDDDDRKRVFFNPSYKNGYISVYDVASEGIKHSVANLVIQNGQTLYNPLCPANSTEINLIVGEGIKNTYPDEIPDEYDWRNEFETEKVVWHGEKV